MHLPRTILLGLGPLLSLWAMSAQMVSGPPRPAASEQCVSAHALQQFIQPVVSFLLFAAEPDARRGEHPVQATLGLEALATTPLAASIWMVREHPAIAMHARLHQSPRLRC